MTGNMVMIFVQGLAELVALSVLLVGGRYLFAKRDTPAVEDLLFESRRKRREEDREAMLEWERSFYGTPEMPTDGATPDDVARWQKAYINLTSI